MARHQEGHQPSRHLRARLDHDHRHRHRSHQRSRLGLHRPDEQPEGQGRRHNPEEQRNQPDRAGRAFPAALRELQGIARQDQDRKGYRQGEPERQGRSNEPDRCTAVLCRHRQPVQRIGPELHRRGLPRHQPAQFNRPEHLHRREQLR